MSLAEQIALRLNAESARLRADFSRPAVGDTRACVLDDVLPVATAQAIYKAFPRNDEISVNLTFNGPPRAVSTVPDGRGIPIVVHYSIIAPPQAENTQPGAVSPGSLWR